MNIRQQTMTLREAAALGLMDFPHEFIRRDWERRAIERPEGMLYAYFIGECFIGMVDGEEAIYSTLCDFEDGYEQAFADFWQELRWMD